MKLPLPIAEKLLQLLRGEILPASSAKHAIINDLVSEGILERSGRIKKILTLRNTDSLIIYLKNRLQITDLEGFTVALKKQDISRSDLVAISSDSKLKNIRSFKGFLVNCYQPISAVLNNENITLQPMDGAFHFIYDFESFIPAEDLTIVGIENAENFRNISKQKYLFEEIKPLFVCRYPQNQCKDLIKWLQNIPNSYLHFGDFDFAGIGIYLNEFNKHISQKSQFFVPKNIEILLLNYGDKSRYDIQKINFDKDAIIEAELLSLVNSIHKYKRGLDQEIFINIIKPTDG